MGRSRGRRRGSAMAGAGSAAAGGAWQERGGGGGRGGRGAPQARRAVHRLRGVVQAARGQDASDARHGGVTPETAEEQEVNAMSAAPLSTSSAPLPMAWLRVPTVPTSAANSASALNNGNSHK